MNALVQRFSVAHLIFVDDKTSITSDKDVQQIEKVFKNFLESFKTDETYYSTNGVHKGGSKLPYNTFFTFGAPSCNLFIHFSVSYGDPLLFVYNSKEKKVQNYINIQQAKLVLDKDFYQNFHFQAHFPKIFKHSIPHVADLNKFVNLVYMKALELHNNPECLAGRECFELNL